VPQPVNMATQGDMSPALRRLGQSVLLSQDEIDFFEGIQNNIVSYKRGESILGDGHEYTCCYAIRDGWAMAYRITAAGRRQIVALYLPGDFIGLHINFHRKAIFNLDALTKLEVALIEPMRLIEIHQKFPVLASGLDWSSVRSLNILGEHNVSLGARTADQRILHLMLEIWCRLLIVGEANAEGFTMRMTQQQTADVLGLSLVHTNKMLKSLIKRNLLKINGRHVSIPNLKSAIEVADFDPAFLDTFRTAAMSSSGNDGIDTQMDEISAIAEEVAQKN